MSAHWHGSQLALIGNVQINFGVGVTRHFVLSFSYLLNNWKCWLLTLS